MCTHLYNLYSCLVTSTGASYDGAMYVVMSESCDRYVYPVSENKEKYLVLNHATNEQDTTFKVFR